MTTRCSYIRLTATGPSEEHWKKIMRNRGYAVDHEDDPCYVEPIKSVRKALEVKLLPTLQRVVKALGPGEILGVPTMSHFGNAMVWFEIAQVIIKKGATVEEVESGRIIDPAKAEHLALGATLVQRSVNGQRRKSMVAGMAATGHYGGAKKSLDPAQLERCREMYVDIEAFSVSDIAAAFDIADITVYRSMGKLSRTKALELHKQGKWLKRAKK